MRVLRCHLPVANKDALKCFHTHGHACKRRTHAHMKHDALSIDATHATHAHLAPLPTSYVPGVGFYGMVIGNITSIVTSTSYSARSFTKNMVRLCCGWVKQVVMTVVARGFVRDSR